MPSAWTIAWTVLTLVALANGVEAVAPSLRVDAIRPTVSTGLASAASLCAPAEATTDPRSPPAGRRSGPATLQMPRCGVA